ncbi:MULTISPECIES: helix-turn-helix domain-containing protein [Yersinia]|uniref:helix-turn-helix domain-containing protein n=1 Tax=Yersinia TaxID=629 RepID=UPI0009B7049D|nr:MULTISPECIES: helix-turn-helix domain-containing protein [Yersinia]ARB84845.1 helix-turn-helix domain-containing protein [Yersinia sp. FDAARGOS_228]AVL34636.1 helix-turn-helix domain-containing protein [Yersinia intermedia]MCB5312116.1 helix-turn-helix domain-containing protein [Yersinia intermedia]MCB5326138.1 helix-turn-helix domain-containing protein [Yersinia intermedia]
MKSPGERIKARRNELQLTQRSLSKAVKVSHVTISQWESNDSSPSGKNLFALSAALKCSPTWILYGDVDKSPPPAEEIQPELDEQEIELIQLFASLPESEKEQHLADLRVKVDGLNKLFEELLKARKKLKK